VVVGQDESLVVDDYAASRALLLAESPIGGRGDDHHRRTQAFVDIAGARQPAVKDVCESFESFESLESLEPFAGVGEVVVPAEALVGDEPSSSVMATTVMATKALTRALARMAISRFRIRITISI